MYGTRYIQINGKLKIVHEHVVLTDRNQRPFSRGQEPPSNPFEMRPKMPPITPRMAKILAALGLTTIWLAIPSRISPLYYDAEDTDGTSLHDLITSSLGHYGETDLYPAPSRHQPNSPSPAEIYLDQTFSLHKPAPYAFPALREHCNRTTWKNLEEHYRDTAPLYLECDGIYLGLTSVISQVKSCLKMAIEAGVGVILPQIPLRDATNLVSYNQGNRAAEREFGEWFDAGHLVEVLGRACPALEVVTPTEVEARKTARMTMDLHAARFFRERDGYFWAGKPFGAFFDGHLDRMLRELEGPQMQQEAGEAENQLRRRADKKPDAVVVGMRADFELFNVANDPTGHDRHLWDDLGRALRFLPEPRLIVDRIAKQIGGPFFAVHFRGEADNFWDSPEEQMRVDLDALDRAWEKYRDVSPELAGYKKKGLKPPVYLACGDEGQLLQFVAAGKERGWNVTSKYDLAKDMGADETLSMIESLPFDFQAIIDLGMLVKSHFLIGLIGSAFSYTAANVRDPTTRYRGSSFELEDDGGARTHMFPNNDVYGDATMEKYACCL